ncbi:hypothetical protein KR018_011764, partial [Drosophila ironensis]
QKKCQELDLEETYEGYKMRLMRNYLPVFSILHALITVVTCLLIAIFSENWDLIFQEIMFLVCPATLTILILSVYTNEKFLKRYPWTLTSGSVLAALVMAIGDLGMCLYLKHGHQWPLYNHFDMYIICVIYMFLPISSIRASLGVGVLISCVYVAYETYFEPYGSHTGHEHMSTNFVRLLVDIVQYICFNMLGLFYRLLNDTLLRSSFLDHHQFVLEEGWLREARVQEAQLLNSILPAQIAKSLHETIKERIFKGNRIQRQSSHFMSIQMHPDVSILYADVVNYTHLTTTLPVEQLVQVLHDLYGRFDIAAKHFKVQRIKFLGDCYYCVAGMQEINPDNAKSAVDLGIAMIANIKEVREERNLDIDMRIGVHSGQLYAGVIGIEKIQLDIWGKDVEIANRLESTGQAGYVHVSSKTLNNLDLNEYTVKPGPEKAQRDPVLQELNMKTYLITGVAPRESVRASELISDFDIQLRPTLTEDTSIIIDNPTLSMQLKEKLRKAQVAGIDFRCCRTEKLKRPETETNDVIWFLYLFPEFRDKNLSYEYSYRPDYLLKYSVSMSWLIGLILMFCQAAAIRSGCVVCIYLDVLVFFLLSIIAIIMWYKKFCYWYFKNTRGGYNSISCTIFKLVDHLQRNSSSRIALYLGILIIYAVLMAMIAVNCDLNLFEIDFIFNNIYEYEITAHICFRPWAFTNTMALMIGMTFTFAHISFNLKTLLAFIEVVAYIIVVFNEYTFLFHHSATTFSFMPAEYAHTFRVLLTFILFYAKDRQQEFNSKSNFKMNMDLKEKKKAAEDMNHTIIILLTNILPSHVVELYISNVAKHELYYENYEMVSVMFAMLMNFKMDLPSLRVLNDLISEFDKLIYIYREYYVVEKIKVVGCTYMAACGLDFSLASLNIKKSSLFQEGGHTAYDNKKLTFWRETQMKNFDSYISADEDQTVLVMTTFALDLMRTLRACNEAYSVRPFDRALSTGSIAIGISSGPIMAGVVGASHPHYDIWGNAVNMASRMETTGLEGHIQVTKESAKILQDFGIGCTYRGMTYVKGVGAIPTYFVDIGPDLTFLDAKVDFRPSESARASVFGTFDDSTESSSKS